MLGACWFLGREGSSEEDGCGIGWIEGRRWLALAENEGDGRVGWIGRDPEENEVAAARGKGGWDRLGLGFRLIYIARGLG